MQPKHIEKDHCNIICIHTHLHTETHITLEHKIANKTIADSTIAFAHCTPRDSTFYTVFNQIFRARSRHRPEAIPQPSGSSIWWLCTRDIHRIQWCPSHKINMYRQQRRAPTTKKWKLYTQVNGTQSAFTIIYIYYLYTTMCDANAASNIVQARIPFAHDPYPGGIVSPSQRSGYVGDSRMMLLFRRARTTLVALNPSWFKLHVTCTVDRNVIRPTKDA